jgi:hypothetical protein
MIRLGLSFFLTVLSVCVMAQEPVPVFEEPYHRLVFEDGSIRILDLRMAPGDTSAFHVHRNAIAYIGLNGSQIWLDVPGLDSRSIYLPDDFWGGDIEYPEAPFVHRIANVGKEAFRLMAIEHLEPRTGQVFPEGYLSGWTSLDVNPYFLIHRRMLQPAELFGETLHGSCLLIGRGEGLVQLTRDEQTNSFGHGDWQYITSGHSHIQFHNAGMKPIEVVLVHF